MPRFSVNSSPPLWCPLRLIEHENRSHSGPLRMFSDPNSGLLQSSTMFTELAAALYYTTQIIKKRDSTTFAMYETNRLNCILRSCLQPIQSSKTIALQIQTQSTCENHLKKVSALCSGLAKASTLKKRKQSTEDIRIRFKYLASFRNLSKCKSFGNPGWSSRDLLQRSCKNRLHQTILARILQERSYLASPEKSCKFPERILQGKVWST